MLWLFFFLIKYCFHIQKSCCCCSVMSDSLWPHGLQQPQVSLFFTVSPSLLKLTSIESVIPSNHLIPCHPLLLLPSVFPSIRVFSSEPALWTRWSKYWSFSLNIQGWSLLGLTGLISLLSKGLSRFFSSTTVWKHQFSGAQPSLWSNSHICTWLLKKP